MCKLLHAKMMLFEMHLFVQEAKLARASFPPQWNDVVQDALVLLQDGNLSCASFTPRRNDVVRDVLVLVQERKLACTSFHPQ
jgi:hypothetical protein